MDVEYKGKDTIIHNLKDFDLGQTMECGQCFHFQKIDDDEYGMSAYGKFLHAAQKDDKLYLFDTTKEEFEKMIARDELIEYARYVENYYGTPKQYVMEQLEAGKDVILEIEIQGALKVKEKYPDTLLMFVTPPSAQVLKDRLVGRGTETAEVIDSRMKRAVEESQGVEKYDYLVINDDLERCAKEMHSIIQGEHDRVSRNADFIDDIRKELKEL